jgi:hypothetical protein
MREHPTRDQRSFRWVVERKHDTNLLFGWFVIYAKGLSLAPESPEGVISASDIHVERALPRGSIGVTAKGVWVDAFSSCMSGLRAQRCTV